LNRRINIAIGFTGIMLVTIYSCNNYSISDKQAESFIKYFPLSVNNNQGNQVIQTLNGGYVILAGYSSEPASGSEQAIPLIFCDEF
jgi:hypothetical protein